MRRIILLLMVILVQTVVVAEDAFGNMAQQAEAAYRKGDFETAVTIYQQLIGQGVKRSEVYFNLANAYYQLHDLGHALVNYRRTEVSTPRDEDLRLNLARIRVQRLDGTSTEAGLTGQIVKLTSDWLSPLELGWLVLLLWWIFCGCVATYFWRTVWRSILRWAIWISAVLFICVFCLALIRIIVDNSLKPAVVITDSVSVMTGPGTNYLEIFELHAAAEIRIVEERNHWIRFQLPDLREGWINEQSLEVI